MGGYVFASGDTLSPQAFKQAIANIKSEYNYYGYNNRTQTTFKASGSADIKNHEFSFGIEYEQRNDAAWGVNPVGLWGHMRLLANKHLLELDLSNPNPVFNENGIYKDTVNYDRLYVAEEQAFFDRNLRVKLGFILLTFCKGAFMKIIIRLFALVVLASFIGCATAGGGGSSSGGSKSKLSDADFKRMGINKNSHGGNSY